MHTNCSVNKVLLLDSISKKERFPSHLFNRRNGTLLVIFKPLNPLGFIAQVLRLNNKRTPASTSRTTGNNSSKSSCNSSASGSGSSDPDPEPRRKSPHFCFKVVSALSATFRINGGAL